ncbi:YjcZ family sporulation protein [Bacillus sp. OK048]|nr:YjcZ family sporulation protein [Bacillus sp. OK048]SDN93007.1 conserved hypothetical tiny transmembrane protein [Bacillus sp. OK048]
MSEGHRHEEHRHEEHRNGRTLVVVLFILLIIVGTSFMSSY